MKVERVARLGGDIVVRGWDTEFWFDRDTTLEDAEEELLAIAELVDFLDGEHG